MSESVPSSVTSFAHRRARADSTTSFTYFDEDEELEAWPEDEAVAELSEDELASPEWSEGDRESEEIFPSRRKSSSLSRMSAQNALLRHDSAKTGESGHIQAGRLSQKVYILTEDMTIVIAGFTTRPFGLALYFTICVMTLGLGYLILRWLPRWRVRLIGSQTPLRDCTWVAIEVSFAIHRDKACFDHLIPSEPVGRIHRPGSGRSAVWTSSVHRFRFHGEGIDALLRRRRRPSLKLLALH